MDVKQGNPLAFGAVVMYGGVNFCVSIADIKSDVRKNLSRLQGANTGLALVLYYKNTDIVAFKYEFTKNDLYGDAACIRLGILPDKYDYSYEFNTKAYEDKYARVIIGNQHYGKGFKNLRYSIYVPLGYDEEFGIKRFTQRIEESIPFEDAIVYKLNVREFSADKSANVKHPGTFLGLVEKLDYLCELGVNVVDLMPVYDFNEKLNSKLNVWGYGDANYFAVKTSYTTALNKESEEAVKTKVSEEFKEMVAKIHERKMEVWMEFFFAPSYTATYILECLRFWALEYSIDGFKVNPEVAPLDMLLTDPILGGVKIMTHTPRYVHADSLKNRRYAQCNGRFMTIIRRYMRGDEGLVNDAAGIMLENHPDLVNVNYLATHDSMSLYDSVSYEYKHNEDNGENNMDGTDYNCSLNCGKEGASRSKKIVMQRDSLVKSELIMLLTSQGTPEIYYGDEFGRTNKGNNNPYCQDNDYNRLNFDLTVKNKDLFEFTKKLIKFRKDHKILHPSKLLTMTDNNSTGTPDASYHGLEPWRVNFGYGSKQFAIMYNESYAGGKGLIYTAFNPGSSDSEFLLPYGVKEAGWKVEIASFENVKLDANKDLIKLPPFSSVILTGRKK